MKGLRMVRKGSFKSMTNWRNRFKMKSYRQIAPNYLSLKPIPQQRKLRVYSTTSSLPVLRILNLWARNQKIVASWKTVLQISCSWSNSEILTAMAKICILDRKQISFKTLKYLQWHLKTRKKTTKMLLLISEPETEYSRTTLLVFITLITKDIRVSLAQPSTSDSSTNNTWEKYTNRTSWRKKTIPCPKTAIRRSKGCQDHPAGTATITTTMSTLIIREISTM